MAEEVPPPPPSPGFAEQGRIGQYQVPSTSDRSGLIKFAVKIVVIGMSIMMLANGVLAFSSLGNSKNALSDAFVAIYITLFASLLFFHEITQFYPIEQIDEVVARNFGFLFKPFGKGLFMIFIAFLNFGLTVDTNLGLSTGICLSIVGFGYIVLYLRNPEIFENEGIGGEGGKATLPPYVPQSGM